MWILANPLDGRTIVDGIKLSDLFSNVFETKNHPSEITYPMKNSKSIHQQVQELKKNVSNQLYGFSKEDVFTQEEGIDPMVDQVSLARATDSDGVALAQMDGVQNLNSLGAEVHEIGGESGSKGQGIGSNMGGEKICSKIDRQKLSMAGMEMLVSAGVSYAIAWGIGGLFTLSSPCRIIMGAILAFAVNALAVYRIIKK
jgi:hypothetical protein